MNNFQLMKNDLIDKVDKLAINDRPQETDLKNTLKYTPTPVKPVNYDSNIYSSKMIFRVPREYDNLAQMFIKCTLSTVGAALPKTNLGTRIFKQILIQTTSGTSLQDIRPAYTLTRIDEVTDSPMYNYIQNAIDPDATFEDNTVTLYIPLFTFFSESPSQFLPTRSLEPLEVLCYTNDTKELMGLTTELTAASYELHLVYHDTPAEKKQELKTGLDLVYVEKVPKYLLNSYDIFYEDVTSVASGATTARILLRNCNPSYVMHMALIDPADQSMVQIATFKLSLAGEEVVNMDERINFSIYNPEISIVDQSTLSYWFGKEKKRTSSSGLIEFSDAFYPAYLDLTFSALSSAHNLHVFFEHKTKLEVSESGKIVKHAVGYLKRT